MAAERSPRDEALEAARDAVEAHEARPDVRAVRRIRLIDDLQETADRLDQHLREWPDPPGPTRKLRGRIRSEIDRLETALEEELSGAAPNLCHVLGANLAARLIAEAGTLEDLARLASSTVQVLGAKQAVLRAKQGADPPKHGVLFLHPEVASAPPEERGGKAKALAGLVSLAARADAWTGRDLADELNRRLADL